MKAPRRTLFMGSGDSSLDFELRAWTDEFGDYLEVRSAICVGVSVALEEAQIVIPFPQRDLHVMSLPTARESGSG